MSKRGEDMLADVVVPLGVVLIFVCLAFALGHDIGRAKEKRVQEAARQSRETAELRREVWELKHPAPREGAVTG